MSGDWKLDPGAYKGNPLLKARGEQHDFTQEQLKILIDKNTAKYVVNKDPNVENLYSIEVRKVEATYFDADSNFLYNIENHKSDVYEVLCELSESTLTVTLNTDIKEQYRDVDVEKAQRGNAKHLCFFVTTPNDPHFLFQEIVIPLSDLLINNNVTVELENPRIRCSLFTKKIFNTYKMIRKV